MTKKRPHGDEGGRPVIPELPTEGGSYVRSAKTGKLRRHDEPEPDEEAAGPATPVPTTPQPDDAAGAAEASAST